MRRELIGGPAGRPAPAARRSPIISFLTVLIRGYAAVHDVLVWQAPTGKLPVLDQALRGLLDDMSE